MVLTNRAGLTKMSSLQKSMSRSEYESSTETPILRDHQSWSSYKGFLNVIHEFHMTLCTEDLFNTLTDPNHGYFCVSRSRGAIECFAEYSGGNMVLDWEVPASPDGISKVGVYHTVEYASGLVCVAEIYLWPLPVSETLPKAETGWRVWTTTPFTGHATFDKSFQVQFLRHNDKTHHFMAFFGYENSETDHPMKMCSCQVDPYLEKYPRAIVDIYTTKFMCGSAVLERLSKFLDYPMSSIAPFGNTRFTCRPLHGHERGTVKIGERLYYFGRDFRKAGDLSTAASVTIQRAWKRRLYEPDRFFQTEMCVRAVKRFRGGAGGGGSFPEPESGVGVVDTRDVTDYKKDPTTESEGGTSTPFHWLYRITPTTDGPSTYVSTASFTYARVHLSRFTLHCHHCNGLSVCIFFFFAFTDMTERDPGVDRQSHITEPRSCRPEFSSPSRSSPVVGPLRTTRLRPATSEEFVA